MVADSSIWLVEDDASIGSALLRTFRAEGYDALWAESLSEARALPGVPDLVVLDRGLPDGDGLELCRELTELHPGLRVVILTARTDEIDVVLGLDAGASDYVAKPFGLGELMARVRAQLRIGGGLPSEGVLVVGDLSIDLNAHQVRIGGQVVHLRPKEFALLARLAVEAGSVVRRETLMLEVWDVEWFGDSKTLDVHIASLRRRIDDGGRASRISTVRGFGYRMERSV